MAKIKDIIARQIIDSRGNPTVEVDIHTDSGSFGRASVPSGASTGKYEAVELRDGFPTYCGKSVSKAIKNIVNLIKPVLMGTDVENQIEVDRIMISTDGTHNKSKIGANAILAVSLATAKAAADYRNINLFEYLSDGNFMIPVPMMNILNGGAHADNLIDIQEFMIVPNSAKSFSHALRIGVEIFHSLKEILKIKNLSTNVGDEGGFAPNLSSNEEAIEIVIKSIKNAGYKPGSDVSLALDAASSEFYNKDRKVYILNDGLGNIKELDSSQMVDYWDKIVKKYPISSIEDALDEDDWEGWINITNSLGRDIQLVGDDLFVTNSDRLKRGISLNAANSILIKPNQVGTLTETLNTVKLAKEHNYGTIISHRSGETEDVTISDLSVACCSGQIKTGSLSRTDRVSKYNQLLRIEEKLGDKAVYSNYFKK